MNNNPNDDIGSDEWYETLRKRWEQHAKDFEEINSRLDILNARIEALNVRLIMRKVRRDPKLKAEYIDKLFNPLYTPTRTEEIVIKTIFDEGKDA